DAQQELLPSLVAQLIMRVRGVGAGYDFAGAAQPLPQQVQAFRQQQAGASASVSLAELERLTVAASELRFVLPSAVRLDSMVTRPAPVTFWLPAGTCAVATSRARSVAFCRLSERTGFCDFVLMMHSF